MPLERPREFRIPLYNFTGGVVGNISEAGLDRPITFLRRADNAVFHPPRAVSLRLGSRALSTATLASAPHSLGKLRPTTGTARLFVGRGTGISLAAVGAYTSQTMPGAAVFGGSLLRFEQLNDVLWVTEHNGANKPFGYIEGVGWVAVDLPAPVSPDVAVGAAGNVNAGVHYYRVRNRFVNGASGSTPTTPNSVNPGVASQVTLGAVTPLPVAGPGGRTDWLGWTIERTKANDPKGISGQYYQVAQGTAATYLDNTADSLLWDRVIEGWYTGPQIFNGVIAHRDRMFGWKGSLLYPSWEIGADAQLGIFNFDPLNSLRVGADDGDVILTAVPRAGQLVLFKSRSMHFLDGSDLATFDIIDVPETGGVSGPRCACTVGGGSVFFFNDDGLFIVRRNSVEPFGWEQIGHYLADLNESRRANVVLRAIGTHYLVMAYSSGLSSFNNEALVYDFRTRTWSHFTHFNAEDLLYQEDADFSSARVIVADGEDQDPGGGTAFQCWVEFDGTLRKRAQNGSGGSELFFSIETPLIDGGEPEMVKELRRVTVSAVGEAQSGTLTISSDTGDSVSVPVVFSSFGSVWGDDDGVIDTGDLVWDDYDWAGDEDQEAIPVAIPRGLLAKRFKVALAVNASKAFRFNGMTLEGDRRPERRMRA